MSIGFSSGDLVERWSLSFSDIAFVNSIPELAQLGFAVQLKFFAAHRFFVRDPAAIPAEGILYLAEQLGLNAEAVNYYDFSGRTARRHCAHGPATRQSFTTTVDPNEHCAMNSANFLESVDNNFRHAMSFLDLPEGLGSGSSSATRPMRFASACACVAACTGSSAGA
ncbi:hypothetical protein GGE07_005085 [Sinorhizobium terangae]|nr:hypothetical protein [Sinorhizobium terangae]